MEWSGVSLEKRLKSPKAQKGRVLAGTLLYPRLSEQCSVPNWGAGGGENSAQQVAVEWMNEYSIIFRFLRIPSVGLERWL